MAPNEQVSDSTDWLPTPLSAIAPLESSLRCQVCKDFFNTPMVTTCSHTFCSLCIRRYLSQEGRCPACRQNDQESKLRRNWVVEELVTNFVDSRKGLLEFAKKAAEKEDDTEQERPKKKRKIEAEEIKLLTRSTRSQSRMQAVQASQGSARTDEEVPDTNSDSEYEDKPEKSTHFPEPQSEPGDGLIACPGCGRRMKEAAVFTHLDTCASSIGETSSVQISNVTSIAYTQLSALKQTERLPTLAYSMLNDNALRKKLKELGISSQGPKLLMQKRHTEWVNLWNANCDSRAPRPKRELLHELDMWERTQGKQIASNLGPSGVMAKDFDGDAYIKNNKNDFDDLIRKAREKAMAKKAETSEEKLATPTPSIVSTNSGQGSISSGLMTGTTDIVPESPSQRLNGFVDLTSPPNPETQELQFQASQPQNITT